MSEPLTKDEMFHIQYMIMSGRAHKIDDDQIKKYWEQIDRLPSENNKLTKLVKDLGDALDSIYGPNHSVAISKAIVSYEAFKKGENVLKP